MVSLFGLKIGGGKKSQSKEPPKPRQRIDQNTLGEGEFFGRDLVRPQFPGSRPGSSRSNRSNVAWNAPYAGPMGASSMVDLSVPAPGRKGSFASLRAANAWGNGSSTSLALPPPNIHGVRPGTPTRPKTANGKKEWVNPLDVHFGRDSSASRPGTRAGPAGRQPLVRPAHEAESSATPEPVSLYENASAERPPDNRAYPESSAQNTNATHPTTSNTPQNNGSLGQFDFGVQGLKKSATLASVATTSSSNSGSVPDQSQTAYGFSGYPSPPKSISPVSAYDTSSFGNKPTGPSSLRHVDTAIVRPPSPSSTSSGVISPTTAAADEDEGEWQAPVIRNVHAKRDTLTYHPPRRQSFTMELQSAEQTRDRQMQEDDEPTIGTSARDHGGHLGWRPKKPQQAGGLDGNFAGFDFGESVRAPTIGTQASSSSAASWRSDSRLETPETRTERSDSRPDRFMDEEPLDPGRPAMVAPERHVESPIEPRRDELWASEPFQSEHGKSRAAPVIESSLDMDQSTPLAHPPAPLTRPTEDDQSYFPPVPAQRRQGPPRAAAGAHPGHRTGSDRPAYGPRPGLTPNESAPRGFASRDNADTHPRLRAPPVKPLLLAEPNNERPGLSPAISSAYSRSQADENSVPATPEDFPIPQNRRPERPLSSPFNRPPMVGDFPKSKGLPRGRRPEPITIDTSSVTSQPPPSTSSSRWRPWNSPSILSPRSEAPSFHQHTPKQYQDSPDQHGYTLPNWDDFDSAYDRHKSAVPAPLSPGLWSPSSTSSSAVAPRLPSPTFPSLEKSISSSSPTLASSFELFYDDSKQQRRDENHHQPLISPVMGSFGGISSYQPPPPPQRSPRRTEAQKAPPRPAPITVPPSRDGKTQQVSTAGNEFQATFI